MEIKRRYYIVAGVVLFLILLNVLFYFVSPEEIVHTIGVKNSYLIIFAMAAIGGLSTITGTALFASIATFTAGGSSPFFIGILAGLGIFISDSIFYYLVVYGKKHVPESWGKVFKKMESWIEKYPMWVVLSLVYIYLGFTPLPNDILMVALVAGGYPYKKIAPVLLAGSLTIAFLTAYIGNALPGV